MYICGYLYAIDYSYISFSFTKVFLFLPLSDRRVSMRTAESILFFFFGAWLQLPHAHARPREQVRQGDQCDREGETDVRAAVSERTRFPVSGGLRRWWRRRRTQDEDHGLDPVANGQRKSWQPWTSQEQPWAQGLRSRDPIGVVAHLIRCGFTRRFYQSVSQSVNQSVSQSISQSVTHSINQSCHCARLSLSPTSSVENSNTIASDQDMHITVNTQNSKLVPYK